MASFRRVIEIDPGNGVAQHMIAAITGAAAECAPREYVASLFDAYAGKFDAQLAQTLAYDVPQRMASLVAEHAPAASRKWDALDLGCGTGMVGAEIAHRARELVGVDVSKKMLEHARRRGIYTRLVQDDLLAMLQREPSASYDLVTAADVFIYVGRIDAVVGEVRRVLRPGGAFAFSVETLDAATDESGTGRDLRLRPSGRFAHAPAYLANLAAHGGFRVAVNQAARIRIETGLPMPGFIALWQSAPA